METPVSKWMTLCGQNLILPFLVPFSAASLAAFTQPTFAQEDRGDAEPSAAADDASDAQSDDKSAASGKPKPGAPQGIPTRLSDLFRVGGPMMWPLAVCSIFVVAFAIERQVLLRR